MELKKVICNKVMLYMLTRYITYGLQFITTLIIAQKLGPYDYGLWSFLLLLINFFNIVDFGISNSLNVLLVQYKKDPQYCQSLIKSSILIVSIICLGAIVFISISYFAGAELLKKYDSISYLPIIVIIVILAYFNKMFVAIFRTDNKLFEVALYQSLIPLLLFISVLCFNTNTISYMVYAYLIGNAIIIVLFLKKLKLNFSTKPSLKVASSVMFKGFWLFLYNSAFYLIMYIVLLSVSEIFSVGEYGKFSFSYTLSNSIFLLIDAFGYIIFPKMVDILKSDNPEECRQSINNIRLNYTTMVYLLVFFALPLFEIFTLYVNKYNDIGSSLCLSAVALLPYSSAFGINTYLIAQNLEKKLSFISILCLLLTGLILFLFSLDRSIQYDFYYLVPFVVYFVYTLMCAALANKKLKIKKGFFSIIIQVFPFAKLIPLIVSVICILAAYKLSMCFLLIVPAIIYVILNINELRSMFRTFALIVNKPNIIDIEK